MNVLFSIPLLVGLGFLITGAVLAIRRKWKGVSVCILIVLAMMCLEAALLRSLQHAIRYAHEQGTKSPP